METIYHILNDGLTSQLDAVHQERWECEVVLRVLQVHVPAWNTSMEYVK